MTDTEDMKEGIRRSMEDKIGEGATDDEKIAFLKGLKECLSRSRFVPKLQKFKEDNPNLKEHNEILKYFMSFGKSIIQNYNRIIDELINEFDR